jgi:hypothetical protein
VVILADHCFTERMVGGQANGFTASPGPLMVSKSVLIYDSMLGKPSKARLLRDYGGRWHQGFSQSLFGPAATGFRLQESSARVEGCGAPGGS